MLPVMSSWARRRGGGEGGWQRGRREKKVREGGEGGKAHGKGAEGETEKEMRKAERGGKRGIREQTGVPQRGLGGQA